MNALGDVDLNAIPDDVLLSALSLPVELGTGNYTLDQQHLQQQQLHAARQVPQHASQYAQHLHPHMQYTQPQQHQALQQQQQQQQQHAMQHQQQQQSQYYQNFAQSGMMSNQNFSAMTPSYPYQPTPPAYHSGVMNPLHSPSHSVRNSSADLLPLQNNSLPSMASQTYPAANSFSPTHTIRHTSPSAHVPSSPNSNNRRTVNRAMSDATFEQAYRNLEQLVSQDTRQTKTRMPQNSNTMAQTSNTVSQNSANSHRFDTVSPNRPAFNRSNSLNSQGPPNQTVQLEMQWPYPGGNSIPQTNTYQADGSMLYSQGRSGVSGSSSVSSSRPGTNAPPMQSKSNQAFDNSNSALYTFVDLDKPFVHPSSQNHKKSSQNTDRLNNNPQIGSHASNPGSEFHSTSMNGSHLMKTLLSSPPSSGNQNRSNELPKARCSSNLYNSPTVNARRNSRPPGPEGNARISNNQPSTAGTPPVSYQPRYPSPSSRPNVNPQSAMTTPGKAPSNRPPGLTPVRGTLPTRGSRGGGTSVRGMARGAPPPPVRDSNPSRGQQGAPSMRGAPPARGIPVAPLRGAPFARGQPVRGSGPRGAPSGRGVPSVRGRGAPAIRGTSSARGVPSRGVSNSNRRGVSVNRRGSGSLGGGRGQSMFGMGLGGFHGMAPTAMESSEAERPVGNPIQWYRLPETATAPAPVVATPGFQSDIEAMRASMSCEVRGPSVNTNSVQNQRQNRSGEQPRPGVSANSFSHSNLRTENSQGMNASTQQHQRPQTQSSGKETLIRLKQEIVDRPSSSSTSSANKDESPVSRNNNNDVSRNAQPHQTKSVPENTTPAVNISIPTGVQTRPSDNSENSTTTSDSQQEISDMVVDRKPLIGAVRDRVHSLWRAGQVVGRAPAKSKPKAKVPTVPSTSCHQTDTNANISGSLEVSGQSEVAKRRVVPTSNNGNDGGSNKPNSQAKTDKKNLFYVLLHGHKLICIPSGSGDAVLVSQFQYECFADKGKGMVSNCINKALRIKKRVLDHPDKEAIISFLRNNGYLKGTLQNEPIHVMSLDDARRVYHFIYNIKKCSFATCVVDVSHQAVDLNIVMLPSKRKILTQEMKMRIKREKKQIDDERYGRMHSSQTSSHRSTSQFVGGSRLNGKAKKHSSGSDRSDQTLAYGDEDGEGDDDLDDVVIVEGPEDPYLLKWDGKQSKPGCVCNTIVGQVRSYHHEGDNYLVVSDLCRILGTSEFMTGIETDNVILYSCTKDILSFLNELSINFPQLDTGQNCLVKEKDVGVHSTDEEGDQQRGDQSLPSDMNRITPLKRPFCKQEVIDDDGVETCSNPKQQRLSNDVSKDGSSNPAPTNDASSVSSLRTEKRKSSQDNVINEKVRVATTDMTCTKDAPTVSDRLQDRDDSNVIIVFDTNSINKNRDKMSETVSNTTDPKAKENSKDQKSTTGLSSPDSCLSVLSQDGPQSPVVLRQQKDLNPPTQTNENNQPTSVSSQIPTPKTAFSIMDELLQESSSGTNTKKHQSELNLATQSQIASDNLTTSSSSKADEGKSKRVVATVIDINSLTNVSVNKANSGQAKTNQSESLPSTPQQQQTMETDTSVDKSKGKTRLRDLDSLLRLSSSKGLPVLKTKCVEDDLELSKLHVTSLEGLEEYRSRGSLLKEMEVLRFKNKTLQETLKALRDQLKKSKAQQEKSEKLATYYGSVIQEITATFKDGDKVEPGVQDAAQKNHNSGMETSPICIDDDD